MRYKAREELDMLPPGDYDGVIKHAEDTISKSGNESLKMIVTVYSKDGSSIDVFDYLVAVDSQAWKVRHFCKSAGLSYEAEEIRPEDVIGRNVMARIVTEDYQGQKRSKIADYLAHDGSKAVALVDDDIPF